MSRRRFLGGVFFAGAGTAGYAHFVEAEWLQTSHITVPLSGGTRPPLKLLHLSDLHASPVVSLDYINRAISQALLWRPDVICLTGDFVTARCDQPEEYARVLRRLSDAAPCFASLGNHDGGRWAYEEEGGYADVGWISEVLQDGRIPLLHNRAEALQVRDWPLNFVGLGDMWANYFQPELAFRNLAAGTPTILLSHNPDSKDRLGSYPWHLMLSGHTHGGQLRVPFLGTPFAPVQDQRYVAGLGRWNDRWIHVTKGIGTVYGLRINCPPEVSFLTLT